MVPLSVKDLLTFRERLGIARVLGPADSVRPVRRVLKYPDETDGQGPGKQPHQAVLVCSSAALPERFRQGGDVCPFPAGAISCVALPSGKIPLFFREYAQRSQTAVFASRFDEWLIHSRLTGLLLEMGRGRVMVHGTLVRLLGRGVLLMGESGIGKTATALAAMAGDNRWVADDAVVLEARAGLLYGRGHARTRQRIAVRGRGILRAEELLGSPRLLDKTRVDLVVRLVRPPGRKGGGGKDSWCRFAAVSIPCRELPVDAAPLRMAERVMGLIRGMEAGHPACEVMASGAEQDVGMPIRGGNFR